VLVSVLISCTNIKDAKLNSSTTDFPLAIYTELVHDFGEINEGEEVGIDFWFKNQGKVPLVINRVNVGCGCTSAFLPKEPVAPGDSSYIRVLFNSKHKEGKQIKNIQVFDNSEKKMNELLILAFVKN